MSKPEWTDATSYQRGERGKVEPRCWKIESLPLVISVHRYHPAGENVWFVTCEKIDLHCRQLESLCYEDARNEAIDVVQKRLARFIECLHAIPREATTK